MADIILETIGCEQVMGWLEARIGEFQALVQGMPDDSTPLNSALALNWKHRMLIQYGRMVGAIEVLRAFHHITHEAATALFGRIKGTTHWTLAKFASGVLN